MQMCWRVRRIPVAYVTERQGPFCGHVNGALVMKELQNPWRNWQSTRHKIIPTFGPDDPIRTESLLQPPNNPSSMAYVADGDIFERIVENSILAWYGSRSDNDFGRRAAANANVNVPTPIATRTVTWMRHLLTTTTINIAGSRINTDPIIEGNGSLTIPPEFYVHHLLWGYVRRLLPGGSTIQLPVVGPIPANRYNAAIQRLNLCTFFDWRAGEQGIAFTLEGQTPWAVIVPSVEDRRGITTILQRRLLSILEITSLLMIDFPNPVYSHRRARLLQYAPTEAHPSGDPDSPYTFGAEFLDAIKASPEAQNPDSPEWEYLRNLEIPDAGQVFAGRIVAYMQKLADRLSDQGSALEATADYLRLAESRRRLFRPFPSSCAASSNPLNEFQMTLPYARSMPQDHEYLEMKEDGTVGVISAEGQQFLKEKLEQRFKNTTRNCHTGEEGCPKHQN